MPRTEPPETSTSKVALEVAAAMQRILERVHSTAEAEVLSELDTIAKGAKDLRPYQVDEVLEHVRGLVLKRDRATPPGPAARPVGSGGPGEERT